MGAGAVRVATSGARDTDAALSELLEQLEGVAPALVLLFHSPDHDPHVVSATVKDAFPGASTAGCSTAGEVTPEGFVTGSMVAVAFCGEARAAALLLDATDVAAPSSGVRAVAALTSAMGRSALELRPDRQLFITLADGLTGSVEPLLAALSDAAAGMPVVGGSAGDGERLGHTWAWADGVVGAAATALILLEPGVPFAAFGLHHFRETAVRTVVTRASPEHHRVHELDGWPAATRFAQLTAVEEADLRTGALRPLALRRQLGFLVGSALYMRALLDVEGDDLVLGGAVETGMVLRVCEATDLLQATREGLADALRSLGCEPVSSLQFACVGRVIQCPADDRDALFVASSVGRTVGFLTLGEQQGPLKVNYTLAGVLFGDGRV